MALTLIQLAADARLGDGVNEPPEPIKGILERWQAAAEEITTKLAPNCPAEIRDKAVSMIASSGYDLETTGRALAFNAVWYTSGAAALVSPYVVRRAGVRAPAAAITRPAGDGLFLVWGP